MVVFENIDNDTELKSTHAFHLFRIIQEAVTNAVKHSRTDRLEIIFNEKMGWRVEVRDFGTGSSGESEVKKSGGNGLRNMRARAEMVGWEINWGSNTPGGTVVTICPDKKQTLN